MTLQLRREQVLLGAPVLLGVLLAAGLGGVAVLPRWQQLQADQQELLVIEEQRDRLPLLRRQLDSLEQQRQQADRRNAEILGLIAGSGELATFLAQLSEQAAQAMADAHRRYRQQFREITARAPQRFEERDRAGVERDAHERLSLYGRAVPAAVATVRSIRVERTTTSGSAASQRAGSSGPAAPSM